MESLNQNREELTFEHIWLMFKETDKKFQETDRQFKETSKQFKDTDKKFQETDKKLKKLEELFTSQWGKLMESLVEGDLLKLLNDRGIPVGILASRVKSKFNNRQYEFDLIAENGDEIVFVEVKTTLRPQDIKEFEEELQVVKEIFPKYRNCKIYGAVAFLKDDGDSSKMASKHGFLVIRATGSSASIINPDDFKPKEW